MKQSITTTQKPEKPVNADVHLVVMQHGLWGNHTHLQFLQSGLEKKYGDKIEILNIASNEGSRTYDGVDVGGEQIVKAILARLAQPDAPRVQFLSMIGYSLGGLMVRYAAGLLLAVGLFDTAESPLSASTESIPELEAITPKYTVTPAHFITVASPHAGAFKKTDTKMGRLFNVLAAFFGSRSGTQMMLMDSDGEVPELTEGGVDAEGGWVEVGEEKEAASASTGSPESTTLLPPSHSPSPSFSTSPTAPASIKSTTSASSTSSKTTCHRRPRAAMATGRPLLDLMSDPRLPFWQALSLFRTRTAYANTVNDRLVNFTTSAIEPSNIYKRDGAKWEIIDPKYPSIVRLAATPDNPTGAESEQHELFSNGEGEAVLAQEGEAIVEMAEATTDRVAAAMSVHTNSPHKDPTHTGALEKPSELSKTRQLMFYLLLPLFIPIGLTIVTSFLTMAQYRDHFQGGAEGRKRRTALITKAMRKYPASLPQSSTPEEDDVPPSPTILNSPLLLSDPLVGTRRKIILRLNMLRWNKVHARISHRRGHAAIVVRYPGFEDVMCHLVDNFPIEG